jgi:hypothetical protein
LLISKAADKKNYFIKWSSLQVRSISKIFLEEKNLSKKDNASLSYQVDVGNQENLHTGALVKQL